MIDYIKSYNIFKQKSLRKNGHIEIYEHFNTGDVDADGIPDSIDDELSVDRFDNNQRIRSELNVATEDAIQKLNFTRQWIQAPSRNFIFIKDILDNLNILITPSYGGHSVNTMATDGVNLFINPMFGAKISQDEFTFVIIHEIMHNQWEHFFRKPNIVSKISPAMQHTLWNIATDLEINPIISDIKDVVPLKSGLFFDKPIKEAGGYVFDSKVWSGYTADDMFNKLVEILEDMPEEQQKSEESQESQENIEIEIGSIIYDKESGAYGKVISIDEDGDYEIEEMTREAVKNELHNT